MEEQQITTEVTDTQLAHTETTETPQEIAVGTDGTENQEVVTEATTEASNEINEVAPEQVVDNTAPDVDELRQRLKEYELRDEETKNLSERLGLSGNINPELMQAEQLLLQVNNQAQQAYINLCNEFGVDYRPEKIEASASELASKDPKKYYDLLYKLNQLDANVTQQRTQVESFLRVKQTEQAAMKYKDLLNASPKLNQALEMYLNQTHIAPQQAVEQFMQIATPLCQEMFNMGKMFAQQEALKKTESPAQVLNNNTMSQTATYATQSPKVFTNDEIAKMDLATYAKYRDEIDRQAAQGLIK